jgi:hypothetical protein
MLDAERMDEPGNEKDATNRMKPDGACSARLGKAHENERQRHIFGEIPMPPDAFLQGSVVSVKQRNFGFGPHLNNLETQKNCHQAKHCGVGACDLKCHFVSPCYGPEQGRSYEDV